MSKQPDDKKEQLNRIQRLATRLPWIAVIVVLFATTLILLQAFLFGAPQH